MSVTAQSIRDYANWPDKVPEAFLAGKLPSAIKRVQREAQVNAPPAGMEDEWEEAVTLYCIASALPFLHTFTQPGAVYAVQSAQSAHNKFQYMDAKAISDSVERAEKNARDLVTVIKAAAGRDDDADISVGGLFMGAI